MNMIVIKKNLKNTSGPITLIALTRVEVLECKMFHVIKYSILYQT